MLEITAGRSAGSKALLKCGKKSGEPRKENSAAGMLPPALNTAPEHPVYDITILHTMGALKLKIMQLL